MCYLFLSVTDVMFSILVFFRSCVVLCCVVLCGAVQCSVPWCGMVLCCVVSVVLRCVK